MISRFIKYILFTFLIVSSTMALNDENNLNLIAPKKLNQLEGEKDSLKKIERTYVSETPSVRTAKIKKANQDQALNTKLYTKVKLIDVVLETLSRSDTLKSSRENVIQYELKVKNAIADYYPTVNFSYEYGRTKTKPDSSGNNHFRFYTDDNFEFILRQNLYSGFATNYNIKSIGKKLEVARNQYRITLDEEIKKAVKAYFDVVFANRSVKVNERNMKKLNRILKIVTTKYDNGGASLGDMTSIKASVANSMTKLVKIKSKFIESLRYYEYIAGVDFQKTLPYEMNFDISLKEFQELYEHALEKNRNLINYYESIEAEKYEQKKRRAAFEPKLDFELSYGEIYQGDGIAKTETDVSGKVKLTYNLFNGGKDKNKVLESNSKVRNLNYKLEEEKKKIKWNLSKIHTSMQSINEALKSTIEEIKASRKMVSAYWDAFKLGEQDLQTLLQGQRQLNSAETELVGFEKSQIINFFNTLELTGELSSFFNVDPGNPKFIDFSKSDYKKTVIAKDGQLLSLTGDIAKDKLEKEKEIKKQEEKPKEIVATKIPLDEKLSKYVEEFKSFDDNSFTIEIGDFDSIFDAFDFMIKNKIDDNSFTYEVVDKYNIKTKIAHNNFKTKEEANNYIKLLEEKKLGKEYKVRLVKDIKALYDSYMKGLAIKPPKPKVKTKIKIVEKLIQAPVKKEFQPDEQFKNKFLSSPDDFYTINVSSFTDLKTLEKFVLKNEIKDNSFFFRYGNNGQLIKLVYGVYENYTNNIEDQINKLILENKNIFPLVEKLGPVKELYNENIQFNKKDEKEDKEDKAIHENKSKEIKENKKDDEVLTLTKRVSLDDINKEKKEKIEKAKKEIVKILDKNKASNDNQKNKKENITKEEEANLDSVVQKEVLQKSDEKLEKDKPKEDIKKTLEKEVKKEIIDAPKKEVKKELSLEKNFLNSFIEAPRSSYTINLASFPTKELAKEYISNNNIQENSLFVRADNGVIKVLNGIYNTREKANKAITSLPESIQRNNPYLQKIFRVQDLIKANSSNIEALQLTNKVDLEEEKLAKVEVEKKAKLELERKAKLDAEKLAKVEAQKEAEDEAKEKAKLEAQKLEKERLAKLEAKEKEKEEAQRKAKLEAEKFAKLEAQKKTEEEVKEKAKEEAQRKAKLEAEKLAKLEAQKKAEEEAKEKEKLEAQKLEKERLAKEEADKKDKLAKEEAERKAKLLDEKAAQKAKEEAYKKAQLEVERLRKERLEKEEIQRKAHAEAIKQARLKAQMKAKLEAKKAEIERIGKEKAAKKAKEIAERKAKLEAEQKAKEIAERKAKLEAEQKAKEEAEKKAKLEAEQKAKEAAEKKAKEAQKLEKERLAKLEAKRKVKSIENKKEDIEKDASLEISGLKNEKTSTLNPNKTTVNKLKLSSSPIEEIDFGANGTEKKQKVIPYNKRQDNFANKFANTSKNKYTLKIITLKPSEVKWFENVRGLSPTHVVVKNKKRATIYYGIYDTIEEAKKDIVNLHPLIYESNPPVVKIGTVK